VIDAVQLSYSKVMFKVPNVISIIVILVGSFEKSIAPTSWQQQHVFNLTFQLCKLYANYLLWFGNKLM